MAAPGSGSPSSRHQQGLVTITMDEQQQQQAAAGQQQQQHNSSSKQQPQSLPAPLDRDSGEEGADGGSGGGRKEEQRRRLFPCLSPYTLAVLAAIMGNILEFYDFSIYGYFAPEIGKNFFPKSQPSLRAVRTFTVFAGGFLMRPIGSLLLGAIGDRFGTAAALKWSILLMTVPTVVTGCLPTYAKVGSTATFLLTACRLLQGLSVGGEFMGALLHTSDHSPPGRRGLYVGCVAVFGGIGSLLGSIVSVGMRHAMSEEELLRYGWRIPFLTGSIFGFLGIFLRTQTKALKGYHGPTDTGSSSSSSRHTTSSSRVPATATPTPPAGSPLSLPPHARRNQLDEGEEQGVELIASSSSSTAGQARGATPEPAPREPATPSGFYKPDQAVFDIDLVEEAMHLERDTSDLRHQSTWAMINTFGLARFLVVALIASLQSSHYYTQFVWLGTYQATLAPHKIPASMSFAVSAVQHCIAILLGPSLAYLTDRVGGPRQRTLWLLGMIAVGCVAPPALFPLAAEGGVGGAFAYAVLMGLCMGFIISGVWPTWVIETLHEAPARVTVTSIAYNLGAMVGGAYPMLASKLADSKVVIAPVLPTTAWAAALFLLLSLCRFSPRGIFNPKNEPDRDFPSMYHPKSVARHRLKKAIQEQQQRQQQRERLLSSSSSKGGEAMTMTMTTEVRVVEEGKLGEMME